MTRVDEIRELYAFNRWANALVLEAAATLDLDRFLRATGSSFTSVRDTLVHVLSGEWVWLRRLEGISPTGLPDGWATFGIDEIRREWGAVEREFGVLLQSLTEAGLDRGVAYRTTTGDAFTSSVSQILRHTVNHSTYHRGQLATMLRQLGAAPPATDMIHYLRSVIRVAPPA